MKPRCARLACFVVACRFGVCPCRCLLRFLCAVLLWLFVFRFGLCAAFAPVLCACLDVFVSSAGRCLGVSVLLVVLSVVVLWSFCVLVVGFLLSFAAPCCSALVSLPHQNSTPTRINPSNILHSLPTHTTARRAEKGRAEGAGCIGGFWWDLWDS